MKKVQRSFAVEYKSGRRKSGSKVNSIWGDMDLKSVARDVQDATAPFLPEGAQDGKSGIEVSLPGEEQVKPLLTQPIGQQTNAPVLQEIIMTDENNTAISADAPAIVAPDAPKKERKPRARKAVAATASSVEVAAKPAAGQAKRGRKPKSPETVSAAKRAPVKRARKTAASAVAIDEMAGLLQLEEENQKLRKQLAEKLRAENADLKKRLNLA